MMNYMISKLETQMRQAVQMQREGDVTAALGSYNLIFEALRFYESLGYVIESAHIRQLALEIQANPMMTLYCHALILFSRRHYESALESIDAALSLSPDTLLPSVLKGRILTALGDLPGAYDTYSRIQEIDSTYSGANDAFYELAAEKEMPGDDYYEWLQRVHNWLQPASYIEIGLGHGRSLALAGAKTKAVGIDPYQGFWERLNYVCPHAPAMLYPLTSDDFFTKYDLRAIIEKETFDLAFIDGLHLFEQVLKDFINLERYAGKNSVILIHDCLPIAPIVAERERCTGFWTGDVWRIIPCLKTFRPDLDVVTIPTKPSGLGVVTNLDATSTVLSDNYADIVRYYLTLSCPEQFEQMRIVCSVGSSEQHDYQYYLAGNYLVSP
jgi:tetratricopeptide (TPR) repeat protein